MTTPAPKPPAYRTSAMDIVFIAMIVVAVLTAAYTGRMKEVSDQSFESAKSAVTLAIGLIGIMAFWLGMTRVLEAGGLMFALAGKLGTLLQRLFPDVPRDHPAMGAMTLNMSANVLGLGNAATPFGIKAMHELKKLAPIPDTATNAMCMFLAINTSSIAILPLGVIGVRAAAGAKDPAGILIPGLLATSFSTLVAIVAALYFAKRDRRYATEAAAARTAEVVETGPASTTEPEDPFARFKSTPHPVAKHLFAPAMMVLLGGLALTIWRHPDPRAFLGQEIFSFWLMPVLMLVVVLYGLSRGVAVYDAVTDGAKQGFDTAVRIIPFLVAILVAVGMFRASGAMALLSDWLNPITSLIGLPAETVPMAIVRPLSGSGSFAIMSEIIKAAPDSYEAFVASVLMGSSETTFYVLAVYFGAVGVTRIRHALVCGILADVAGVVGTAVACRAFY